MTELRHESNRGDDVPKVGDAWLLLSRARAAVSCGALSEAAELLAGLVKSNLPSVAVRAGLQLALVSHREGDEAGAVRRLATVAADVEQKREGSRERLELAEFRRIADIGPRFDATTNADREFQLELARAWARIGSRHEAQKLYRALLREAGVADATSPEERHLAALAEYRLAELLVDSEPAEAWQYWKRALDSGDERVSPYAALRLATEGSGELVQGRIEQLFRHAMVSSDPKLLRDARLGLARHLRAQRRFDAAREQLENLLAGTRTGEDRALVLREIDSLDSAKRMSPGRRRLTRPKQLRARVLAKIASTQVEGKRVVIVGAGSGAIHLLESLDESKYTICGFVDDYAKMVPGYPEHRVLGNIDQLADVVWKYAPREVLLAIPTLPGTRRRVVVEACRRADTPLQSLPRLHELGIGWRLNDSRRRLMTQLRSVEVEEILGDEPVEIDSLATDWLQYQTALILGAGALGAEFCRRLADGAVGKLVVVDRRSSALRKIEDDLADTRGFWGLETVNGDATDEKYLTDLFARWAPDIVLNTTGCSSARALAPMNVARDPDSWKTIFSNEIGAAVAVANASTATKVPLTVYISSRRARNPVDPVSSMKALAEEIVLFQGSSQRGTVQTVVRVGTLLDSRNGRLTRLKAQIRSGAPVKIPKLDDSVRYLSTARWAELVLHAARLAADGEVIELDGGEEIKIRAIAEHAIRLHGLYPDEHVIIQEVENERWDEQVSDGPRILRDSKRGIYVVPREAATALTVESSLARCAAHLGEHDGDLGSEFWVATLRRILKDSASESSSSL
jgi:FlaA1/EpsC-like NDP-sugar epimerase/tetratricopeptide (TPR) repeat protein